MRQAIAALVACVLACLADWSGATDPSYVVLNEVGRDYAVSELMDLKQGTVAVWVKFLKDHPRRDHSIFHTDDSRFVLFVDTYFSQGLKRDILRIGARAGGNRRHVDSSFQAGNFPEASIIVDNDGSLVDYGKGSEWSSSAAFPEGEWHHVAMTWKGYPEGVVSIYLDGRLMGRKPYDQHYDDGRPAPKTLIVGLRPSEWLGEVVKTADGQIADLRPSSSMSLQSGGIEIRDLRVYQTDLGSPEILQLVNGR